jgi:hypothetical protein
MITKTLAVLTLAIALTACAAGGTQESARPSATDAPPTLAPTPVPTPIDIPREFADQMLAMTQFRADISGTVQVGDAAAGEISGMMEVAGTESHQQMVISFPGGEPQETEEIVLADASYALEDGIWIRTDAQLGDGVDTGFGAIWSAAVADPDSLVLAGTETIDGERLHRLEIQPAPDITAEMLGFTDPAFSEFEATLAFLAEDDGKPAAIVLEATWLQGPDAVDGTMDMRFRFDAGTRDVEVTAPEDAWEVRVGVELGYRMAYPVDWSVSYAPATDEFAASDNYLGPVDDGVQVVAFPDLQGAASPDEWFRWSAQTLMQDFGTEPSVSETFPLADGTDARILSLYFQDGKDEIFFQQAVVVRGGQAWDINWFSLAGNEAEDGERMLQMLLTFEPAG